MTVNELNHANLFDFNKFNLIKPFDHENFLPSSVQSDHTEIQIKTPDDKIINIWNICNPAYQCNFQSGEPPPFHNTHLFATRPEVSAEENGKPTYLTPKVIDQISTIAERFVAGNVNIQIIIEGYKPFYSALIKKISELGHTHFQIISTPLLSEKVYGWNPETNFTGILIDTSRFTVLEKSGVFIEYYIEEGDVAQENAGPLTHPRVKEDCSNEKTLDLPFAHLVDNESKRTMVVAGVHLPGCRSQFPKNGLEVLKDKIKDLIYDIPGKPDFIVAGDFNTPPLNINPSWLSSLENAKFLSCPYPTHVNPRCEAANYDQALIVSETGLDDYVMSPAESLTMSTQELIKSIKMSRQKYLLEEASQRPPT